MSATRRAAAATKRRSEIRITGNKALRCRSLSDQIRITLEANYRRRHIATPFTIKPAVEQLLQELQRAEAATRTSKRGPRLRQGRGRPFRPYLDKLLIVMASPERTYAA